MSCWDTPRAYYIEVALSETMARGWESKAVEAQLEEAQRTSQARAAHRPLSPEMLARKQKRESLQLLRSRLLEQLQRARSDAQRQMLEKALADLEQELAALE
jgi:hypothetical protein